MSSHVSQEYIAYELVLASPAVSCVSGSSNLYSFRDGGQVSVELESRGVLSPCLKPFDCAKKKKRKEKRAQVWRVSGQLGISLSSVVCPLHGKSIQNRRIVCPFYHSIAKLLTHLGIMNYVRYPMNQYGIWVDSFSILKYMFGL